MRLKSIKLAGFKSFVDPTVATFPSALTGIVGPNGCGKSNVIDAVRWVMGESSAKYLRGESMTDVIFNGSNSRKPVGKASVELIFDNSEGRLKGEYAKYNEICIKRVVNRESQSAYYLNGTRCRRKDITGIFLGTGLGPRSYSIIEQGMISRLIEAKPEEFRAYLEEASGISKYKERRRETENRIKHTQENLNRLNDIREELDKQLSRLQSQAKAAEKFKALKEEEREQSAQLNALLWEALQGELTEKKTKIDQLDIDREAFTAKLSHIDTDIEKSRLKQTELNDRFNLIQGRYYEIGSEIARVEQQIEHIGRRSQELSNDKSEAEVSQKSNLSRLEEAKTAAREQQQSLNEVKPKLQDAETQVETSAKALKMSEEAMREWRKEWDDHQMRSAESSQTAEVSRTQIQSGEEQQKRLAERIERIKQEIDQLKEQTDSTKAEDIQHEIDALARQEEASVQQGDSIRTEISSIRTKISEQQDALSSKQQKFQEDKGRLASLQALQEIALGKKDNPVLKWLDQQGLADAPRLAETLEVEDGYETAVETVLGQYLEAVCTDTKSNVSEWLDTLTEGELAIVEPALNGFSADNAPANALIQKVSGKLDLAPWLGNVFVCDDVQEALQQRGQLLPHQSIVTKEGIWLGSNWIRICKSVKEQSGVLGREQEIKSLAQSLSEQEDRIEKQKAELTGLREALATQENQRDAVQKSLNDLQRQHREVKSALSAEQMRVEQVRRQIDRLTRDRREAESQAVELQERIAQKRTQLQSALDIMGNHEEIRQTLENQRESHEAALNQARESAQEARESRHQLQMKVQLLTSQLKSSQEAESRYQQQLNSLVSKLERLQNQLHENSAPLESLKTSLKTKLDARVAEEAALKEARHALETVEEQVRNNESERHKIEQQIQDTRTLLEEQRLRWQELNLRAAGHKQAVEELELEVDAVVKTIAEGVTEQVLARALETTQNRIQRLGAINLMAIEEYDKESERKEYLDAQFADLEEALNTLEEAIKKIDTETRERFKETFDAVDKNLRELFPKVFGGGHAHLELTGEELLDTGVSVIARPPGKRNASIHLLSGGEKALTAIALVFAIFQINPSPFCMLDEVDAPLDDANVGRFCNLIAEMSEKVQFIFITHNKITMELANHLMGVTTNEPGVSRIVAVDVNEAAELAEV